MGSWGEWSLIVEPEDNKQRRKRLGIRKIVEASLLTRRRVTHLDLEFCGISLQINLSGCYILQGMLLRSRLLEMKVFFFIFFLGGGGGLRAKYLRG